MEEVFFSLVRRGERLTSFVCCFRSSPAFLIIYTDPSLVGNLPPMQHNTPLPLPNKSASFALSHSARERSSRIHPVRCPKREAFRQRSISTGWNPLPRGSLLFSATWNSALLLVGLQDQAELHSRGRQEMHWEDARYCKRSSSIVLFRYLCISNTFHANAPIPSNRFALAYHVATARDNNKSEAQATMTTETPTHSTGIFPSSRDPSLTPRKEDRSSLAWVGNLPTRAPLTQEPLHRATHLPLPSALAALSVGRLSSGAGTVGLGREHGGPRREAGPLMWKCKTEEMRG